MTEHSVEPLDGMLPTDAGMDMPNLLRVLIIEDSESDAALLLRRLEKAGYTVKSRRVMTGGEMEAALVEATWDIVFADYRLPRFDAPAALALLREKGCDIPFIGISGAVGEEAAVALMKAGASDYLMKDNLTRLVPVVERELAEAHRRAEYRLNEQLRHEDEARYRALFENSPISLWEEDFSAVKQRLDELRASGVTDFRAYFSAHPEQVRECAELVKVVDANQTSLKMYHAVSKSQLLTNLDVIFPDELLPRFMNELALIATGARNFEYDTFNGTLDGRLIEIHMNWAAISGHEEDLSRVIISVQDISQRKRAEQQLREAETRLRSLVEQVPVIVYTEIADEHGRTDYIGPQVELLTGYSPINWLNDPKFYRKVVHPDDLELFIAVDDETNRTGRPFQVEYRMLTRDGRTVWVRDEAVLIRDENGKALFWQGVIHDITERKRAEAGLQESQRRLAQLMSNLPGMAYRSKFDPEWSMEFVSEGCLLLTGYLPEDLTSGSGQVYSRMVHPDDFETNRKLIAAALEKKIPVELTYRIITASGQEKVVWEHAQGIYDLSGELVYLEGFIIDVTEQKKAEAIIQRHLAELEVLHENSLAINRLIDPRQIAHKVIEILESKLYWHRASIRAYNSRTGKVELLALNQPGLSPAELEEQEAILSRTITEHGAGLSGWVYIHGQSVICPRVKEDSRYVETHPDMRSGLYVPLRTGEQTIGSISVESEQEEAFDEDDERLLSTIANQAAVAIEKGQLFLTAQVELAARVQAETELVQAHSILEQRVVERTADLKAANLELEKAARMKDEFLASMSHELRTPLTGILGLSEVLQLKSYGDLSEKQMAALKHISASGRHLLELINDILDITRIEARQLVLRPGPCKLAQVCESSLFLVRSQAQQKNLQTSLTLSAENIIVQADANRLKQMLANLLGNAVKFTPAGGQIGIDVKGSLEEGQVHITVWDTGIGIRGEDIPRLFQTFVQLDASLARQYNGTGLGLALVKRLAELQGGSVSVESVFGAGSRFTIHLPWTG
ncbi:MAG TPA: PAS domain S-box protein [Anaerolineales bacterium]|jgi:PAS domain S-box-containing protein